MKKILAITAVMAFCIGIIFWRGDWRVRTMIRARKFVFAARAMTAGQADGPTEAYAGFRRALADSVTEATKYLSPEANQAYRHILGDPIKRQMILSWPDKLTELYRQPCAKTDNCLEQAVYSLEYYQEPTYVHLAGKTIKLNGGLTRRELIFIKRQDGGWWIKRL